MGVTQIEDKTTFDKAIKEAGDGKLVVVDFYATWCGPCKMIGPKVEVMSKEITDVLFYKVDVDKCEDIAQDQGISAMPTFKFYKNGEKVDEVMGASEEKITETIKKHK